MSDDAFHIDYYLSLSYNDLSGTSAWEKNSENASGDISNICSAKVYYILSQKYPWRSQR